MKLAAGTKSSVVVTHCQVCLSDHLESILFLGYLPPVNTMPVIGDRPDEQPAYPAEVLFCPKCKLVQLGLTVDPQVLFPPEYPYTSGTTKILRENFSELCEETKSLFALRPEDLVVDIGSNDGTLLTPFHKAGHQVYGIEPTNAGKLAIEKGIRTTIAFFGKDSVRKVKDEVGFAQVITATNVFAHIENIHDIIKNILELLDDKGVFISESHYLLSLMQTLQYDTIYHEHLRYYSLQSLKHLLEMHGMEVIHAKKIPTHGGSIRVYASRKGVHPIKDSVAQQLAEEEAYGFNPASFHKFKKEVVISKLALYSLLLELKKAGKRIVGIGAPSRASTLINYVGLDDGILDAVMEIKGSHKIGKYIPGTRIPVIDETKLYDEQPHYALMLSWHIAEELMPKLAQKGYRGDFIVPLPEPKIFPGRG